MNESPSARLDRLITALEELSGQDACLAAQSSWEEAGRIQHRFATIVTEICPLADSLAAEGFLSESTKKRVRSVMQRQRATMEGVRLRIEQTSQQLNDRTAAKGRITMIRPVYGINRSERTDAAPLIDTKG